METQAQPQEKRRRGRPVGSGKINPEIIAKICAGLENGLTQEGAASNAGIGRATFYTWRDKANAEDAKGIYLDFREALQAAQFKAQNRLELAIHKSAFGYKAKKKRQVIHPKTGEVIWLESEDDVVDTQMQRFIAERRFPEHWRQKVEVSGDIVTEVTIVPSDENVAEFIAQMNASIMAPPEENL